MITAFLAPYISYIVAALTALAGVFLYGRKSGKDAVKSEQMEETIEHVKAAKQVENDSAMRTDAERQRLRKKWTVE